MDFDAWSSVVALFWLLNSYQIQEFRFSSCLSDRAGRVFSTQSGRGQPKLPGSFFFTHLSISCLNLTAAMWRAFLEIRRIIILTPWYLGSISSWSDELDSSICIGAFEVEGVVIRLEQPRPQCQFGIEANFGIVCCAC